MSCAPRIAPGIGATIYGNLPRDISADIVRASDFVTLHTRADASDVAAADRVRALGCSRVWLAIPANYLVRLAPDAAVTEVERCARIALRMGAEVFELNGEGESSGRTPGDWIPATSEEAAALAELAARCIDAVRDVLGDGCAVAWTSHDMPSFRLPWGTILSRVDLHSPQHYPAQDGRTVAQRELSARVQRSRGRWEALADQGVIPANVCPYGDRWAPYLQGWGHTTGATVWGLCEAPVARLWAYPGSWSPEALEALRVARVIRRDTDVTKPDVIARWQAAKGLASDGVVGPRTIAAARGVV